MSGVAAVSVTQVDFEKSNAVNPSFWGINQLVRGFSLSNGMCLISQVYAFQELLCATGIIF